MSSGWPRPANRLLFGPTRNPWDPSLTPSGSSGGSAAAVAAGMVPMAHANDLGGSIRYPASACGLFGLKPTRARNPLGPEYGDVVCGMAVEHAVTRSVRDSAALLDATSGPALGDPYDAPPPARPFAAEVGAPPGRLRIAFTRRTPEDLPVHADCVAAIDDAMLLCEALGHEVVEADLTALDATVGAAIGTMFGAATSWILEYWIRKVGRAPEPDEIEPLTRALWENGRNVTAGRATCSRSTTCAPSPARSRSSSPTTTSGRIRPWASHRCRSARWCRPPTIRAASMRRSRTFVGFAGVVANITGNPAMSVPLSWNAAGVPVGVHFIGPVRRRSDVAAARVPVGSRAALAGSPSGCARSHRRDAPLTTAPAYRARGPARGVSSLRAALRAAWASRRSRIRGGGRAGIGEALRGALLEFGVGLAERDARAVGSWRRRR